MSARIDAAPVNWNALKKFSKVFVTILLSLMLGLAAGEPVLANSNYEVPTITSITIIGDNYSNTYEDNGKFYVEIPIYLNINLSSAKNKYVSGWILLSSSFKNNFYFTAEGQRVYPKYMKPAGTSVMMSDYNASYPVLVFNDYMEIEGPYLIGYYVFEDPGSQSTLRQYVANGSGYSLVYGSYSLIASDYPGNAAQAISTGINNSQSIDSIISILQTISSNTTLLTSVISILNTNFPTVISWLSDISHSNYDLYVLIRDYIEAQNPGEQASEAANIAGSMAAQQAAAEAALVSAAPGNMEDLDAVEPLGILDDVSNSTRFWGTLVQEFSTTSGALWGVFIFALLVGLITFILRLR